MQLFPDGSIALGPIGLMVGLGRLAEGFASTGGFDGLTVTPVGAAAVVYHALKRRQDRTRALELIRPSVSSTP